MVFRDTHLASLYPDSDTLSAYGSVNPACRCMVLTETLTEARRLQQRRHGCRGRPKATPAPGASNPAKQVQARNRNADGDRYPRTQAHRAPAQAGGGFKQLVRELGVRGEERRELQDLLQKLVTRGELVKAPGCYAIPAKPKKGKHRRRPAHHASRRLRLCHSGSPAVKERLSGDIFISPQAIGSAMHGDRVLVELGPVRDGRAEGHILRVVGRAHPTVVGTFHYGNRYNYVTPMDEKITLDVVIPRGMEISAGGWDATTQGRPRKASAASRNHAPTVFSARRLPAGRSPGTIWRVWSSTSRSPTGPRPPRVRAGGW